ncbi:hypothetical protein, partial [Streptomyces cyaneofuscatus]|uniref:hypothetical protein n=1 Tax=Streptomyces cyaneofuscatus TaxID=66883 RepID=UPI0036AE48BB
RDTTSSPSATRRLCWSQSSTSGCDQHFHNTPYAWNLTTADFEPISPLTRDQAMARYPFGMELYLQDLLGILRGHVQVWDVAGSSLQCWHIGRPLDSLVYALFAVYGEHERPDLAARSYAYALGHLASGSRR